MVESKHYLVGISAEDYIHPREKAMKLNQDVGLISKGLDALNDLSVAMARRITLGRHIAVNAQTAPVVDLAIRDVCRILDYPVVPRVYICHQASQTLTCTGTDQQQITLSDYILDQYDVDMLYFSFGNLISMFKAGHVKLVTICSFMPEVPAAIAFEVPLLAYLRAADLSSDRGGLLACQNFSAAARCILWDAGIPVTETRDLSEMEIIRTCEEYIKSVEFYAPNWMSELSVKAGNLTMMSMPHVYRLKELLSWYKDGYTELVSRYSEGVRGRMFR